MSVKLIAVDMDGTVLRTDKTVSARTLAALRKAAERGIAVVPATGRVAKMLPKQVASIPGVRYAITSNGASVVDLQDGSAVCTDLITREETDGLLAKLCATGFFTEAYCGGISYAERSALDGLLRLDPPKLIVDLVSQSQIFVDDLPGFIASRGIQLEKVNLPYLPDEPRDELYRTLSANGKFSLCSSCPNSIEINARSCSKGRALEKLCGLLHIDLRDAMAVGDSGNDVEMLRRAGLSVAMGNAEPEALAAADTVTAGNDEDGVALAIEKYALT